MGSIRPLVTITILVVVGAYLYTKINEGPIKPNTGANENWNQPPEDVPPLAATTGASLATDSAAPAWPPAATAPAPATPPLAAAPAADSNPAVASANVSPPLAADSSNDQLPAVPTIPELPELPVTADAPPAPGQPAASPASPLPTDIPTARYPDQPGQQPDATTASNVAGQIEFPAAVSATLPPLATDNTNPQNTADPTSAAPPIANPATPLLENPAALGTSPLPASAVGAGPLDPALPQATSQNPLRPATPEPDRYGAAAKPETVADFMAEKTKTDTFATSWATIQAALDRGDLKQAHQLLSNWHNAESLSPTDAQKVETLLGQLAGTVIYSNEHQLEPARVVKPNETLETIAKEYNVPWQLLAKINGVQSPNELRPGQELKVVRGPFSAVVDLRRNELTLQVNGCYAGQFPVTVAPGTVVADGQWLVDQKLTGPPSTATPTVYAAAPAAAERTIVLRNEAAATAAPGGPTLVIVSGSSLSGAGPAAPAIRVAPQDAEELSDILSIGSRVVVLR